MKISAALAADLGILTAALDEPAADVQHSLHRLGVDARAAVPTYLGLSVIVDGSDRPFTFSTLDSFIRRRLRSILRKQAKRPGRGRTFEDHRRWPNVFFADRGLFTLKAHESARDSR